MTMKRNLLIAATSLSVLACGGSAVDTSATIADTALAQDIYEAVGPAVQEKLSTIGTSLAPAPGYQPAADSHSVDIDETFTVDGTTFTIVGESEVSVDGNTTTVEQDVSVEWAGMDVTVDGTVYGTSGLIEYTTDMTMTLPDAINDLTNIDPNDPSSLQNAQDTAQDVVAGFDISGKITEVGQIEVDGEGTFAFENTITLDKSGPSYSGTVNGEPYAGAVSG